MVMNKWKQHKTGKREQKQETRIKSQIKGIRQLVLP